MTDRPGKIRYLWLIPVGALLGVALFGVACGELRQADPGTFYSETRPPKKQEFRWTNGKMPKSFDPALASAPPETDIVRAVFEGLTDTDPKTLDALPAVASSWSSADGTRVWTFVLRKDVFWSNGERVTAHDFVRSWKRLAKKGLKVPYHSVLHNIVGVHEQAAQADVTAKETPKPQAADNEPKTPSPVNSKTPKTEVAATVKPKRATVPFGVEAVDDHKLRVRLSEPDEEFPKLVAHPMFRPVYGSGDGFDADPLSADIITNGAFRIASVGNDGVTLERDERYFDKGKIRLTKVKFIPSANPDAALAAYKAGEVDVVTNADFEPLALKLLKPFVDFRQTTHSALNFYEFNLKRTPFNDRRVREALAISIDRQRLTEGEMEGTAKPAYEFLPFKAGRERKIGSDVEHAKKLFEKAGFPNAAGFPKVRLLVNRNNVQEKIARSVAKMWKDALNIETELILKKNEEIEEMRLAGDYDIVRRGVVLPTADETANMLSIFSADQNKRNAADKPDVPPLSDSANSNSLKRPAPVVAQAGNPDSLSNVNSEELLIDTGEKEETILTEAQAIATIPAIPLYFPTSYSLVKPYVLGFEMNTLDAPTLKNVYIDSYWQPRKKNGQS